MSGSGDLNTTGDGDYFYYDGHRVLEHHKHNGTSLALYRQYVYGLDYIDEVVAYYDSADTPTAPHFILQDVNYNVVATTDHDGHLEQQYNYKPYGERLAAERIESDGTITDILGTPSLIATTKGHQGLDHMPEIDGINNRTRILRPDLGRFMQEDPDGLASMLGFPGTHAATIISVNVLGGAQYADGLHLYGYVGCNPLARGDATGLGWHHIVPVALGGHPDGPVVWLEKAEHDRVTQFWKDQGLWFKEDQPIFWGEKEVRKGDFVTQKLTKTRRRRLVFDSLVQAGIDTSDPATIREVNKALKHGSSSCTPGKTPGGRAKWRVHLKRWNGNSLLPGQVNPGGKFSRKKFRRQVSPRGVRGAKRAYDGGGTMIAFTGAAVAMGIYSGQASASYSELIQLNQSIGRNGPTIYEEIEALDLIKDMNTALGGNTFTIYYGWNYWREAHGACTRSDQNIWWAR